MRTAKTLIRLGGCPGRSESSLGAHSLLVLSCCGLNPYLGQKMHILILIFSLNISPPLPWSHSNNSFLKFYQDVSILFFFFLLEKSKKCSV